MRKRIVVLGASFAGLTGAIELKKELKDSAEVVVIDKSDRFLFMPSLIWVPFGLRDEERITFPVAPVLREKDILFAHDEAINVDLAGKQVITAEGGIYRYDYLLIATGPKLNFQAIPGFGPGTGYVQSIFSLDGAVAAGKAFQKLLAEPGPVVVGAVQGASCFGAAYEFLFNIAYQLRRHHRQKECPLTFLTAEPFLAHLGMGGFGQATKMTEFMFKQLGVKTELNASVKEITADEIRLDDGRVVPFKFAMLAPAFQGVDAVRKLTEIVDDKGFVKTTPFYNTEAYPEVFAAGVAVSLLAPVATPVPCAVPKTGYLSEEMAKTAAGNIVATIDGKMMTARPPGQIDAKCVMDAGDSGIIMSADQFLEPREHVWLIPGPEAHWAKLAFEKFFLATHRRGIV